MRRFVLALIALLVPALVSAATPLTLPVARDSAGNYILATPTLCILTDNSACPTSGGGGGAATIADGADVAEGSRADAAWTSGSGTVIAINKALVGAQLATNALLPASIGTKTAAGSLSVTLASDGTLPLPTGAATLAAQSTGNASLASIDTKLTAPMAVVGNVASLATDSGAPVKTACVYNTTLPTPTAAQRVDCQSDGFGSTRVLLTGSVTAPADTSTTALFANTNNTQGGTQNRPLGVLGYVWNGTNNIIARGDTNGAYSVTKGGSSMATGQVSATTSATLIAAARTGRQKITVSIGAANTCAFGNTGVTTTTGFALAPTVGASLTLDTAAAIYAVCSATTTISYVEQY